MLLKLGVDISRLDHSIRSKLDEIDKILGPVTSGGEAIVTSTYEGTHSSGSLHYHNKAIDFRRPRVNEVDTLAGCTRLKITLGPDYDVVLEATHIHIEYDPK